MNITREINFLKAVAANNNRPWFQEHKEEYTWCKDDFEKTIAEIIAKFSSFDSEIANLQPKDCCYRFYRDVRFSQDKSPYKRHFGAYMCAKGKKSSYPTGTLPVCHWLLLSSNEYPHVHTQ